MHIGPVSGLRMLSVHVNVCVCLCISVFICQHLFSSSLKVKKPCGSVLTDDWWSLIRVFIWRRVFSSLYLGHTAVDSYVTLSVQGKTSSLRAFTVPSTEAQPTFHWRDTKCLWKWFQGLRPQSVLILIEHKYLCVWCMWACAVFGFVSVCACTIFMHLYNYAHTAIGLSREPLLTYCVCMCTFLWLADTFEVFVHVQWYLLFSMTVFKFKWVWVLTSLNWLLLRFATNFEIFFTALNGDKHMLYSNSMHNSLPTMHLFY